MVRLDDPGDLFQPKRFDASMVLGRGGDLYLCGGVPRGRFLPRVRAPAGGLQLPPPRQRRPAPQLRPRGRGGRGHRKAPAHVSRRGRWQRQAGAARPVRWRPAWLPEPLLPEPLLPGAAGRHGLAAGAGAAGGGAAGELGRLHLHRLPEQVAVRAAGLSQPQPHPGALRHHLAGPLPVPGARRLLPQEPAARAGAALGPQLLRLRRLHQPLPTEQHHRYLPAGQSHDHAGHRGHPEPGLREDLPAPYQAHPGEEAAGREGGARGFPPALRRRPRAAARPKPPSLFHRSPSRSAFSSTPTTT